MLEAEIPRLREGTDCSRKALVLAGARTALILEKFLATGNSASARRVDVALHHQITNMAGNDQLAALTAQLSSKATMRFGAEPYPSHISNGREENTDLVESIIAQDLDKAYRTAYKHFALTLEIIEEAFRKSSVGRNPSTSGS